jgi:hypothetical protein
LFTVETGQALTIWTARFAAALYAASIAGLFRKRWTAYRLASTTGLATYLVHVVCAFHFFHDWSHSTAYRETARQTEELFGLYWGGGLYLNYLFTMLWAADCAIAWFPSLSRTRAMLRARFVMHVFLSFIVLNATVVVWLLRAHRAR